jgi:general secretion pathway protein A
MYQDFYNLALPPFENTPDPRFFYASEHHREALAAIEYTIRMRKGFVLVTGQIGSGKTTVSRTVCRQCEGHARIVSVLHGHRTAGQLLRQVLASLGQDSRSFDDHGLLLQRLHGCLRRQIDAGQPVVLLVDEAQTLSDRALEELRLLSNFDTATDKLVQVVLVGHPELRSRISEPRHAALRQRIVLAKQLQGLTLQDTAAYIDHRLRVAAQPDRPCEVVFEPPALRSIYAFSAGMPRLINVVSDHCMLMGYVAGTRAITGTMARRAIEDMVPDLTMTIAEPGAPAPVLSLAGNF